MSQQKNCCLYRWTVRADSLKSLLDNYGKVLLLTEELMEDQNLDADTNVKLVGIQSKMRQYEFCYGENCYTTCITCSICTQW